MNQKFAATFLIAAGLALVPAIPAALAQEGRFVMERTDSGFVRLDTFTGEISVCTEVESQIVCRMAADERRALEEQIDLLEERIAEIEQAPGAQPTDRPNQLPTDEEIDRTFGIMEQMMRRFLGIIEEFEQESEDQKADPPKPEKT
ncbi:MAG: DUF342 domain-containing protein [Hyphomicrobiales bacterium]|nr:DUF342 domain-containing protein [Hyphomicrobiales bacterium]MCP4997646.1 DUF342 domain-containing protein [Hyphomicrobiales bacterium]